jgi:hypothetical protein
MAGYAPAGVSANTLLAGGDAAIVRMDSTGQKMLSMSRIGKTISDMEISQSGQIVACGDFGVAVLDATASKVVWNATPGVVSRCAIGSDNTAVALVGGKAYVYDATGNAVANFSVGGSTQNDVAVDGASKSVIATGFKQDNGDKCSQLQIAFLRGYGYDGQMKWENFKWTKQTAGAASLCADTRGMRVAMGRDGKLYFAGESAGGNTIYSRSADDINAKAPNVVHDKFTNPYNTSSNHITYFARFNAADGKQDLGQFLLVRLPSKGDKGNTIRPTSIMADETGRVYLSGASACCIPNAELKQIAGKPLPPYDGYAFLLEVSADFTARTTWLGLASSDPGGVSVRGGVAAMGATVKKGALPTYNAVQDEPATLPDGYLAVWPR